MALTPGTKLGPYEIQSQLGAGGMGEVYRARDTRLDRTVAIKILTDGLEGTPEVRQRFDREARAVSSLNHPHICALYDVGHQNGIDYLVMEYLEGQTLAARIEKGPLPTPELLRTASQIADALDKAHRRGIVHRDLKPGNVIVNKSDRLKVLDFGLAKMAAGANDFTTTSPLTEQGAVLGTLAYVAPEQAMGKPVDQRADTFSFGVMLQQMLTGQRPFSGANSLALLHAVVYSAPASMAETHPLLPEPIMQMVPRMLEKHPADRIQSIREVLTTLQAVRKTYEIEVSITPTRTIHIDALARAAARAPEPEPRSTSQSSSISAKASIAVLRFRAISENKESSHLAEGIESEIVRALSGVPGVRVVSQLGSARFKDEDKDPMELARSLNIRYLLTGSVRQAGNRIRVIAELADAFAGIQLWSNTYDRNTDDIFAAQEEIAKAMAAAISGQLVRAQAEVASEAPSESLDAGGLVRRAHRAVTHAYHREGIDEAVTLLRRAVQFAPGLAVAHAYLGLYISQRVVNSFSTNPAQDRVEALAAVDRAIELAPSDPEVLEHAGLVLINCGKHERALKVLRRTVELAQFDMVAWGYLALALGWGGEEPAIPEARSILDRLIRDTPDHPSLPYWLYFKSGVSCREGKFEEAAECAQRVIELQPRFPIGYMALANALGHLGQHQKAFEAIGQVMALNPNASQEAYMAELLLVVGSPERMEPHLGGLFAAGIFKRQES
jgi:eukaryotic-like serine/threonine-protein kinase